MSQNDELHRLRKENRALKKKLYKLEKANFADIDPHNVNTDCYKAKNYFSFLFSRLRTKNFYEPVQKAAKYFRNSLWITRIFRLGVLLYQYLQAGAFVLLYTAAFILIIPILLSVSVLTLILTLLLRAHNAARLLRVTKQDVVFLIIDRKEDFDGMPIAMEAEQHPDATVLIVSPFFLSRRGIGENDHVFVCYRKEAENIFILRNYFFFYFRRRLLKTGVHPIREIHVLSQKQDT